MEAIFFPPYRRRDLKGSRQIKMAGHVSLSVAEEKTKSQ